MSTRVAAQELVVSLRKFAKAQDVMAANATEDRTHWHHVAVMEQLAKAADTIERLLNGGVTKDATLGPIQSEQTKAFLEIMGHVRRAKGAAQ